MAENLASQLNDAAKQYQLQQADLQNKLEQSELNLKNTADQHQLQQADLQNKLEQAEQNYISVQKQLTETLCILDSCQKCISAFETEKKQFIIKFAYKLNDIFCKLFKKEKNK